MSFQRRVAEVLVLSAAKNAEDANPCAAPLRTLRSLRPRSSRPPADENSWIGLDVVSSVYSVVGLSDGRRGHFQDCAIVQLRDLFLFSILINRYQIWIRLRCHTEPCLRDAKDFKLVGIVLVEKCVRNRPSFRRSPREYRPCFLLRWHRSCHTKGNLSPRMSCRESTPRVFSCDQDS